MAQLSWLGAGADEQLRSVAESRFDRALREFGQAAFVPIDAEAAKA